VIIAELCQNHNGDMAILKDMVFQAKEAGAHFAKIQTFFADDLSPEWTHDYARLKKLELNWDQHAQFVEWCKEAGITPMTSVYSFKYADQLWRAGISHIKIGSAQCTNEDLIRRYLLLGFKVTVSTGGTPIEEVSKCGPIFSVMHCISKYPAHPWQANLTRLYDLKKAFPHARLGFSDHTDPESMLWDLPSKMAITMGASLIEKHFTILDRAQTKDGKVSITFEQLKELCEFEKYTLPEKITRLPGPCMMMVGELGMEERDLINKYRTRWKA
jgi:sialic acid synthase SpsE